MEPKKDETTKPVVIGPEGEAIEVDRRLMLGLEKFRRPWKHYRLIWLHAGRAWLAEEETRRFRRKAEVVRAGQALVDGFGVRFSEVTR